MKGFYILLIIISLFLPITGYGQALPVETNISVSVTVPSPHGPPSGGGCCAFFSSSAKIVFKGMAYPGASLTLLKNNKTAATFSADSSGLFKKELTGLSSGIYNFGIWAEDTDGGKSVTINFTVSILDGTTTTVSKIFISPTIFLNPTQAERGSEISIFGQSFPNSRVNIFISSNEAFEKTVADSQGRWAYKLDTGFLKVGDHNVQAKAFLKDGEQSPFSQILSFSILPLGSLTCQGSDLNFDGKVDLIDFSILLYFFDQSVPDNRCADINSDGIVDIFDFSVMMYWWTG